MAQAREREARLAAVYNSSLFTIPYKNVNLETLFSLTRTKKTGRDGEEKKKQPKKKLQQANEIKKKSKKGKTRGGERKKKRKKGQKKQ